MEFDLKILYYTAFLKANFIMFILEKNTIQECVNQKFRFFLFAFFFNFYFTSLILTNFYLDFKYMEL